MAELAVPVEAAAPAAKAARIDSVDLLRGLVMIVMALDHSRDFFTNVRFDPLDNGRAWPALFFTRWITHYCAPTFMFLAGTSAALSLGRGKSKADLSRFLITRGLFLVVCEHTVLQFGWASRFDLLPVVGGTLWGLGWSMIFLAALIHLPRFALFLVGAALVLGHNAFDGIDPSKLGTLRWIWLFAHGGEEFGPRGPVFLSFYPLVPWVGVMALGYVFAGVLRFEESYRRRTLLVLGLSLAAAFVLLRCGNAYGDPRPWAQRPTATRTLMDFLDCQKYPPSLAFLLMTLGPGITLLPLLERWRGRAADFVLAFGRVPLFFYFAHIFLLHAMALAASALARKPLPWEAVFIPEALRPDQGFGLPVVYLAWILAVLALRPACRWYAELKKRNKHWLLSYV